MFDGSLSPPEFDFPGSSLTSFLPRNIILKPLPTMGDINVVLALRCPICQEPYTEPKQLNCGHSFCLTCLEGSQHLYSINCPICRKATCFNLPGLNGLRLLPSNYALAQIVEAVTSRQQNEEENAKIDTINNNNLEENERNLENVAKDGKHLCVECAYCGRGVAMEKAWFCADCEGGQKYCSHCIVERHRGTHRCIQIANVAERWRAFSCRLDTLKTKLTPVRTSLRQIAGSIKNISLISTQELEKRSDFLCRANSVIEELLEKAEATRSSTADCTRLIDLESLLKKLEMYASTYSIRLTTLKERVDETSSSLNKIINDTNQLEKCTSEYENANESSSAGLENVLVIWKKKGAKNVSLAGTFNEWKPSVALMKYNSEFIITLQLAKGRHEFKFYVDNQWEQSGDYESCEDGCGGRNNVVTVNCAHS